MRHMQAVPFDSIEFGIELPTENQDYIVRIGAWIINEFFYPGIKCAVFRWRDFGLQLCNAFVNLRLCVGVLLRPRTSVASGLVFLQ